MAETKESTVIIDEDDYTEEDLAEQAKRSKSTAASVDDTLSTEEAEKSSKRGKALGVLGKAVVAKMAVGSVRTSLMEKRFSREQRAFKREQENTPPNNGINNTFGDVFAAAMARIEQQQKQARLDKLRDKIEKRRRREKAVGQMLGGVLQGVGQAARTTTMQNNVEQMTANTIGIANRDIPVVGSGTQTAAAEPELP